MCELVPGRYHDFGIDSIPSTIPKSIDSIPSTRHAALIVLYANILADVHQTRMKLSCLTSKRKYFSEQKQNGSDFASTTKTKKRNRSDYPLTNALYQLGFFLFPPHFLTLFRYRSFRKCIDAIPIPKSTRVSSTRYRYRPGTSVNEMHKFQPHLLLSVFILLMFFVQ